MLSLTPTQSNLSAPETRPLILITDDDEIYRSLLNQILEKFGYRVTQASDGLECLNAYERNTPELILLDLEMPGMNGFECLKTLRSRWPDTLAPVLVLSSVGQSTVIEKILAEGATDYLVKPVSWPILHQRIQQALHTRRAIANLQLQLQQSQAKTLELEAQLEAQTAQHIDFYQVAQTQIAELKQQQQQKDHLLHSVSHELRSPLTNMSIAIQLLEHQFHSVLVHKETSFQLRIGLEKTLSYMEILRRQCKQEIQLINNLLDLQLLDSTMQFLSTELLHLNTWLPMIIEPFQQRAVERQQQLQWQVMPDLPPIQTDPLMLERILNELLTNACKYTPPESQIIVTVQAVMVPPSESGSTVDYPATQICVSNAGVTIPDEAIDRIFEPFYRVEGGDRWQQGGTGLGLTLAQRLVKNLGGVIQVSSKTNLTQFCIELPQILCVS